MFKIAIDKTTELPIKHVNNCTKRVAYVFRLFVCLFIVFIFSFFHLAGLEFFGGDSNL